MKLHANYHTHTTFCDGSDSAEAVVQEAIRKDFTHLGFSGHMDPGVFMDFQAYTAEICRLQAAYRGKIDILRGAELDNVYDPCCVAGKRKTDAVQITHERGAASGTVFSETSGFEASGGSAKSKMPGGDIVEISNRCGGSTKSKMPGAEYTIGSTHFVPVPGSTVWSHTAAFGSHREGSENWDLIGVDGDIGLLHDQCKKYYNGDFYALSADYYRFEACVAERLHPTFIGHFDLITRFNDLSREDGGHFLGEQSERYLGPARRAMAALVPYGVPFEINCGAMNRGRKKEVYPRPELLRELHALGGEILISSDAHQKELLDGGFEEAMEVARWAGFTHTNLLVRGEKSEGQRSRNRTEALCDQEHREAERHPDRPYTWPQAERRVAKNTNADEGGLLYWQPVPL